MIKEKLPLGAGTVIVEKNHKPWIPKPTLPSINKLKFTPAIGRIPQNEHLRLRDLLQSCSHDPSIP